MKNYPSIILALAIGSVVAMFVLPARSTLRQKETATKSTTRTDLRTFLSKHSATPPLVDFEKVTEASATDQERRLSRDRLGKGIYTRKVITDPGGREVDGQAETIDLTFIDSVEIIKPGDRPDPPGLPISGAIIVVGNVRSAKAYLNQGHTGVFSEYLIGVTDVLVDPETLISGREELTFWLPGGSLRFPSGHIKHFIIAGTGYPEVGTQYVFFLMRPDKAVNDYVIAAAFSIKDQVVAPLDNRRDQAKFDGMNVTAFMSQLRKAIGTRKGGN